MTIQGWLSYEGLTTPADKGEFVSYNIYTLWCKDKVLIRLIWVYWITRNKPSRCLSSEFVAGHMQVGGKSLGVTWYYITSPTSYKFGWGGLVHLPGRFPWSPPHKGQPWTPHVIWDYNASARIMKCRMMLGGVKRVNWNCMVWLGYMEQLGFIGATR